MWTQLQMNIHELTKVEAFSTKTDSSLRMLHLQMEHGHRLTEHLVFAVVPQKQLDALMLREERNSGPLPVLNYPRLPTLQARML